LPGATHTFKLPVGTKVYQATSAQVDVVMGGRNIRGDDPLFTVLSGDDGKTIRLR
jgi:hypothetical protein